VLVARYADHNAVDRALPLDLDPTALTTGDVVTIGAFGDDAFNRCKKRQPLLGHLSIVGLDDELQTRMQSNDQVLEPHPSLAQRQRGQILTGKRKQIEAQQHSRTL
jgi:hypothetical protein